MSLAGARTEQIFEPLHRDAPQLTRWSRQHAGTGLGRARRPGQAARIKWPAARRSQHRPVPAFARRDGHSGLGPLPRLAVSIEAEEKAPRAAVSSGVQTTSDIAYYLAHDFSIDKGHTDDARKLLETTTKLPVAFAHRDDAVGGCSRR